MVEKVRHGLAVVCAADGFSDGWGDIDNADLGAPFNLVTKRHGVGADKSLEDTIVEVLSGVTGENTVGNESKDGLGAVLLEDGSSLAESAASVGHVIDKDGNLVLDVTDKNHATNNVGAGALLVDKSEAGVEVVGNGGSTLGATSIGGDDHAVLGLVVLANVAKERRLRVQVVDGDAEEALDLRSMEINGDNVVGTGGLQHVGDKSGANRSAGLVFLVLASVGEVGNNGSYPPSTGGSAGRDGDEELHQALVDVAGGGRLDNEDIFVADRLADGEGGFLVRVVEGDGPSDLDSKSLRNLLAELRMAPSADELDLVRHFAGHVVEKSEGPVK